MDTYLKLKKQRTARRIAEAAVVLLSLALVITFFALRENSKVVTNVDAAPFLSYDIVEYTKDYMAAILISGLVLAVSLAVFIGDLLAAKIYYAEIDGEDVIVYNGLGLRKLLVNGEEKDSMFLKSYMEAKLCSGVTLTITPKFLQSCRLTFSDNRPAVDL